MILAPLTVAWLKGFFVGVLTTDVVWGTILLFRWHRARRR